ncbi:hypothetical protein CW304_18275 [Bacillus sp. UFRGS-B20]|nr:hypothetical protein CW304_18275 [Bacillus sp. UFRGS-B20]
MWAAEMAQFNVTNTVKAWVEGAKTKSMAFSYMQMVMVKTIEEIIAAENERNAPFLEVKISIRKTKISLRVTRLTANGSGSGSGHFQCTMRTQFQEQQRYKALPFL